MHLMCSKRYKKLALNMQSLTHAACEILCASTPQNKVKCTHTMTALWNEGKLSLTTNCGAVAPVHPGRPSQPELINPRDAKRRRLGTVAGRVALLHAIAHIEFNAINLAADMVARYANDPRLEDKSRKAFITDWVGVCDDEARHFIMIEDRLQELGSHYGALPAHNGLWEAAISTMNDIAARLVIAPMVLEARGLDVTPGMITKLESVGDQESAEILKTIYQEEIGHVAAGTRWFSHICTRENKPPEEYFKSLVDLHFTGSLKPPFNTHAREKAGMPATFYQH